MCGCRIGKKMEVVVEKGLRMENDWKNGARYFELKYLSLVGCQCCAFVRDIKVKSGKKQFQSSHESKTYILLQYF